MSVSIAKGKYSYQITNEPVPNTDPNIYEFNGIRCDEQNREEAVRILYVKKNHKPSDLTRFDNFQKIGELPPEYSDDLFHQKYLDNNIVNGDFDMYISVEPLQFPQQPTQPRSLQQQPVQPRPSQHQPVQPQPSQQQSVQPRPLQQQPAQHQPVQPRPPQQPAAKAQRTNKNHHKNDRTILFLILFVIILLLIISILSILGFFMLSDRKGNKDSETFSNSTFEITSSSESTPTHSSNYKLGDVNEDGFINSVDASRVLAYYSASSTDKERDESVFLFGDVNHDGKCDSIDASMILGYYSYSSTDGDMSLDDYLEHYYGK